MAGEEVVVEDVFSVPGIGLPAHWRPSGNVKSERFFRLGATPACAGETALWFSLSSSDPVVYRSELRLVEPRALRFGAAYAVTYRVCMPASAVPVPQEIVVLQFHSWPDLRDGESWKRPHLTLSAVEGHWQVQNFADSRRITPAKLRPADTRFESQRVFDAGPVRYGEWETWSFHVVFSPDGAGRLRVLRNGEEVARHSGPNAFNDADGPFLKMGIYVPALRDLRATDLPDPPLVLGLAVSQLSVRRVPRQLPEPE